MSQAAKRLEAMRRNPRNDWRIEDVEMVCRAYDVGCDPPSGGGSHYTVYHASQFEIVTVPFNRPIKPVYIRALVSYIDAVVGERDEQG